jgi:hypothetical protein
MLNSRNESEHPSRFPNLPPPSGKVTSLDVRSLPPGTALVVDTRDSRYHFVMLDGSGSDALVQGGDFRQETKGRINGSTLGGSVLRIGWIVWGLSLEISVGDQRIVTSRVHSIRVEIKPVATFPFR